MFGCTAHALEAQVSALLCYQLPDNTDGRIQRTLFDGHNLRVGAAGGGGGARRSAAIVPSSSTNDCGEDREDCNHANDFSHAITPVC